MFPGNLNPNHAGFMASADRIVYAITALIMVGHVLAYQDSRSRITQIGHMVANLNRKSTATGQELVSSGSHMLISTAMILATHRILLSVGVEQNA